MPKKQKSMLPVIIADFSFSHRNQCLECSLEKLNAFSRSRVFNKNWYGNTKNSNVFVFTFIVIPKERVHVHVQYKK